MTQPAPVPQQDDDPNAAVWQQADQLAGMQAPPPQPLKPDLTPPDAYKGGAPQGSILATPRQATAEDLNSVERQKDITSRQGQIAEGEGNDLAKTLNNKAAEDLQRSQDYDTAIKAAEARHVEDHQRTVDAYNAYKQAAPLKDPTDQFWADKKQGSRTLAAFAAFASGLGAGIQGQGGNPFLDYLNKQIQANYNAHKENIEALYQKQVAAGKISDDADSHEKFMQDARLHSMDLAAEHYKSQLEAIKNRALGANQRTLADMSIEGLTQQQIAMRKAQAQQEAAAAAAASAAYRAKAKEVQASYENAYKDNMTAGYGEEQSRQNAAKFVEGKGYDRSLIAPIAESNGGQYNTKTGKYEYQEIAPKSAENGLIPTVDAVTGKPIKPEERRALEDQVVTDLNGNQRLARNKSEVPKITQQVQTIHNFNETLDQLQQLQDKWKKEGSLDRGELAKWDALTGKLAIAYNGVAGSERATAEGEVENLKHNVMPESPGILGSKVAGIKLSGVGGALQSKEARQARIDALKDYVKSHSADIEGKLHPQGAAPAAAKPTGYVPKSFKPAGT